MDDTLIDTPPRRLRTMGIMAALGLLAGFPAGWLIGKVFKAARIRDLPWSDEGALTIAATFVVCGLVIAVLSGSRRGRAILANPGAPEFRRSVTPAQTVFFRLQAGVLLLAGGMLAAPVISAVLARGAPVAHGSGLLAALMVCFVAQTALNLMIWFRADEVFRQVIAESGAASFWLLQGAYFIWACGVKLQVLPEISSWDAVTVLMGVYLIMSSVIAYRRGLG